MSFSGCVFPRESSSTGCDTFGQNINLEKGDESKRSCVWGKDREAMADVSSPMEVGCQFPLLRRRFLAAAGWIEDPPAPMRPPEVAEGGGDAASRHAAAGTAPSLNLLHLARDDDRPQSELQQRREKFAFFEKRCSPVAPGLFLSSDAVARNRALLAECGITHVLNCAGHICGNYFEEDGLTYRTLWLMDTPAEDLTCVLYANIDFVRAAIAGGGKVLIHCSQGVSRSSSCVMAFLMATRDEPYDSTYAAVKAVHGIANPNMGFACQLIQWHKRRTSAQPASPPRLYRIAPHSAADPAHLVPKHCSFPQPLPLPRSALDPRTAYVLHTPTELWVWLGAAAAPQVQEAATEAAAQLCRYERAPPAQSIRDGEEPVAFWQNFTAADEGAEEEGASAGPNAMYDAEAALVAEALAPGFVRAVPGTALSTLGGRPDASGRLTLPVALPVETPAMGEARGGGESVAAAADGASQSDMDSNAASSEGDAAAVELYEYPAMDRLTMFDGDDLTPDGAFLLVVREDGGGTVALYVWLGSEYDGPHGDEPAAIAAVAKQQFELPATVDIHIETEGNESAEFWNFFEDG